MSRTETFVKASPIDRAAAAWLARRVRGLTSREQAELARWLQSDPRHAQAFAALELTWSSLDRLKELDVATRNRLEADLPALPMRRPRQAVLIFQAALATAAALAIAYVGWWRPARASAPFAEAAATEIGGQRKLSLPDGSSVDLNTDTAVEVAFTAAERRVRLRRGEARFSVAKRSQWPFVVEVAGVDIRAVGTAFNVRLRPEAVEVIVTEGKVRVADTQKGTSLLAAHTPTEEPLLQAGQRVLINVTTSSPAPETAVPISPPEIERALAWQERRLIIDGTPLAEVVAEFNRYNRRKLVIVDARLNERQFGGTFTVSNAEGFVRLLESRFGVKAERTGAETRLRLAEPGISP
jgi:transmembrane sensor